MAVSGYGCTGLWLYRAMAVPGYAEGYTGPNHCKTLGELARTGTTHPGYTSPRTPLLHALVLHAAPSAQRLALSVKTVISGSSTYHIDLA